MSRIYSPTGGPVDLLGHALALGLAAYFVFYAQAHAPFLRPLHRLLGRLHPLLPKCPWCLGAWIAIALTVAAHAVTHSLHPAQTPVQALAAAATSGLVGSFLPDDTPTEDYDADS